MATDTPTLDRYGRFSWHKVALTACLTRRSCAAPPAKFLQSHCFEAGLSIVAVSIRKVVTSDWRRATRTGASQDAALLDQGKGNNPLSLNSH